MRKTWMAAAAALMIGCGAEKPAPPPKWADDAEELRYLKSLGNPSPEQFKRRESLQGQATYDEFDARLKQAEEERAKAKAKP